MDTDDWLVGWREIGKYNGGSWTGEVSCTDGESTWTGEGGWIGISEAETGGSCTGSVETGTGGA